MEARRGRRGEGRRGYERCGADRPTLRLLRDVIRFSIGTLEVGSTETCWEFREDSIVILLTQYTLKSTNIKVSKILIQRGAILYSTESICFSTKMQQSHQHRTLGSCQYRVNLYKEEQFHIVRSQCVSVKRHSYNNHINTEH